MKAYYNETVYVPQGEVDRVFKVNATIEVSTDKNFGADIDGNRGTEKSFVTGVNYESVVEVLESGEEVTVDVNTLPKDIQEYIDTVVCEEAQ